MFKDIQDVRSTVLSFHTHELSLLLTGYNSMCCIVVRQFLILVENFSIVSA